MKRRVVQTIENNGTNFGQVSNPQDVMKAQDFLHERISNLTQDFLNNYKDHEIIGFEYALGGEGNAFEITVKTPGRVYAKDGKSYDFLADVTLDIPTADANLPRLDLVVAVLENDIDAALALIPFVQLRTPTELANGVPPYAPVNFNAPTEKHHRAVVQIKSGMPGATPSVPSLNANEVPLYLIAVAPGATQIRTEDIADYREVIRTLRVINELVKQGQVNLDSLAVRVDKLEQLGSQPIDLSQVFGQIKSLAEILALLQQQINAFRDLPDIRYEIPRAALTDPASSKIMAAGNTEIGTPVVDIEIGGRINFGGVEVILRPEKFADAALNARFAQIGGTPSNVKVETPLVLNGVTQMAADGSVDFVQKASAFGVKRARPATAARDGQYVEIYGGLAANNYDKLGDWSTYDTLNDTLTPRVPSVNLPESDRPAMFPYGDGTHVLLICGKSDDVNARCFKLNCVSGVVTEITTTKPIGKKFIGDKIADGKIFVCATRDENYGFITDFWEFDTATGQFTQLTTTGSVPTCSFDHTDGCHFKNNQFVLVTFMPGQASGRTYLFRRTSLQWTEVNITGPYGGTIFTQQTLRRFRMANVNGRPLLVGGLLTRDDTSESARVWELLPVAVSATVYSAKDTDLKWVSWNGTFPPVQDCGFCSMIVTDNLPKGNAFLFGGHGKFSDAKTFIYASVQAGLVATTFNGQPAITISESSTYAQFIVPIHTLDWQAAGYLMSLFGSFNESNLKAEVSFNGGEDWHLVSPDKFLTVADTSDPTVRHLRITLYNLKTSKPIIAKLTEVFDEDGSELETRLVIRYNSPNSVKALYVDRNGVITLSPTIEPSTPEKCLLHKVTPNGSSAPTVKNYINRRRPHVKYSKVKDGSAGSVQFSNELAVPVRYVDARAVKGADSVMYKIADPTVNFDAVVNIVGVSTNGDTWIVELEG